MAVKLSAEGFEQRQIATHAEMPDGKAVTQTAVSDALMLDGQMRQAGLADPYVLVTQPPKDYTKLRRHLNPRYRFTPVVGYEPPQL